MRIAKVGFHAAQSKNNFGIAFRGAIFGCHQRLIERDTEAAFQENRQLALAPYGLEQFKILRVAGTDLQHHTGRVPGERECGVDFFDMHFTGDLHRNHPDAVFTRELEYPRQTLAAHALKRIRTGAWLVRPHARAHLAVIAQAGKGLADEVPRIDGIEPCKGVQILLRERYPVVAETGVVFIGLMATEDTQFSRHDYSCVVACRRRARTAPAS